MTLNQKRLLRYLEYATVSASVAGAIAAVATRQLVYAAAPLSVAAALNLLQRHQWQQQLEQRLNQTTTQVDQRLDELTQRDRQLAARLQALPQINVAEFAQLSDIEALQSLSADRSQQLKQLATYVQRLRQHLARQNSRLDRSGLDSIPADLRNLQVSLNELAALNFDERLLDLERRADQEPTAIGKENAPLREAIDELRNLSQRRWDELVEQRQQREERLQDLPESNTENFAQLSDLRALREESTRRLQQLADDLQALRQNLDQPNNRVDDSELSSITAELRQQQAFLHTLAALNIDARLQQLAQAVGESTAKLPAIDEVAASLQTDIDQLRNLHQSQLDELGQQSQQIEARLAALLETQIEDTIVPLREELRQLRSDFTDPQNLLRQIPTTAPTEPPDEKESEPPIPTSDTPEFRWEPPQLPSADDDFTLDINLGIDFGTGFTKVCFRNLATNRSEIVTFSDADEGELNQALLSTKIAILEDGTLLTGLTAAEWDANPKPVRTMLEFIKMRLAHLDLPEEPDWRLEQIPELEDPNTVEHLCVYYLSCVIRKSQNWIQTHRPGLFKDEIARWSVNIGVPVAYCDSPAITRFEEVLDLAWLMANTLSSQEHLTLDMLGQLGCYLRKFRQESSNGSLDCSTTPEISAAVWSFLSSRQAEERFYTFFDFGDGTLDGATFRFSREGEDELKIDFYSGQVKPLGVTAFIKQAAQEIPFSPEDIRQALLVQEWTADHELYTRLEGCNTRNQVHTLVASVIHRGVQNHKNDRGSALTKDELGQQLDVFVSGGGGHNAFLRRTVEETHEKRQHCNHLIPPYAIKTIPVPKDLNTNGLSENEFHRFAVAYGLCIPNWEGPQVQLPSKFK